ncbi:expressed unknown protein [Seminavis robusta]|uniref:Uncharacterized protein n=1 Tax=Seminavis robusta TaxID=568900 RepID=A0A9N8DM92_9STRA|nr:expressed unknown protein [Seminavis robusta]|eukprot:Sro223_g091430.1 n/a (422) ;mRNA; r:59695-61386
MSMFTRSILKDPNASSANIAIWKKVCFDDVHIREYAIVLGDNPAVSKGAPLQITWDYHNEDVIDVDIFEQCREPVRRHRKKIVLSARKRAKILLGAGHTVEEIADMTLQCQNSKRQRVESVKEFGKWDFSNLNVNLADFMTGTAEVTGRTLKLVGIDAIGGALQTSGQAVGKASMAVVTGTGKIVMGTGKVAGDVVLGTGKFATDVVVGTGKLGVDVVVGTGKVATDVVVGTVKGTGKVLVGTGRVTTDVVVGTVVGTGTLLKKGTDVVVEGTRKSVKGTLKGIGKAPRRITNIFSQGELIRTADLKDTKDHLKHIDLLEGDEDDDNLEDSNHSAPQQRGRSKKDRRNTELSPPRPGRTTRISSAPVGTNSNNHNSNPLLTAQEDAVMDELAEMEEFMMHLQEMDPEQVKRALGKQSTQAY